MVDRIDKLDSSLYRVHEADPDKGRGKREGEEEHQKKKEKDKFDHETTDWKLLMPKVGTVAKGGVASRLPEDLTSSLSKRKAPISKDPKEDEGDEVSQTEDFLVPQKFLVAWGLLDTKGKLRPEMIISYTLVITVLAVSAILIFGILLKTP